MSQYDAVALRTLAAIRRKGAKITFGDPNVDNIGETYDPDTDTWSDNGAGIATGVAIRVKSDPMALQALGLTLSRPITLLVAAKNLGVVPTPEMVMTFAGQKSIIKHVETTAPDGTPIFYRVVGDV